MSSIPKPTKCIVRNIDMNVDVVAHFNPKELSIDKEVPWNEHKSTKSNLPVLEFTDAKPKLLSVELFFDTYESREDVYEKYVKLLEGCTEIVKGKRRPPMCMFMWAKKFPAFMGVITSVSAKYSMFLPDGTPVRATVTIKMKQAEELAAAKEAKPKKDAPKGERYSQDGTLAKQGDERRADKHGDDHRGTLDKSGSETGTFKPGDVIVPSNGAA